MKQTLWHPSTESEGDDASSSTENSFGWLSQTSLHAVGLYRNKSEEVSQLQMNPPSLGILKCKVHGKQCLNISYLRRNYKKSEAKTPNKLRAYIENGPNCTNCTVDACALEWRKNHRNYLNLCVKFNRTLFFSMSVMKYVPLTSNDECAKGN